MSNTPDLADLAAQAALRDADPAAADELFGPADEPAADEQPQPKRAKRKGSLSLTAALEVASGDQDADDDSAAPAAAAAPARSKRTSTSDAAPSRAISVGPVPHGALAPIERPNGELYYPRPITSQLTDVDAYRTCRQNGENILLYGYPGTGKTSALEAAFNGELVTIEGNGDTEVRDLIGGYVQKLGSPELQVARDLGVTVINEGQAYALAVTGELQGKRVVITGTPSNSDVAARLHAAGAQVGAFVAAGDDYLLACGSAVDKYFEWEDGPAVIAMKQGKALLIDDATKIAPNVLSKLFPAMDGRRVLRLEQKVGDAEVRAADGFCVVAAHNPGAPMAVLEEAFASRFLLHVEVSSDFKLARKLGVDSRIVNIAEVMRTKRFKNTVSWAPEMRELLAYKRTAAMFGDEVAARNLLAGAPEDARDELKAQLDTHFSGKLGPLGVHG